MAKMKAKANPERPTMTVRLLADMLGLAESTILRWDRDGALPPSHRDAANNRRWFTDEIAKWLEKHRAKRRP